VAPVYDVGQLPDDSPYFAMKLIQGRTRAELLAERPRVAEILQLAEANRQFTNLPPRDELPRFLRYFEVVCQGVGYAHSQLIIHRDLKPHNVMVGAFGEVQVMDWGLAKRQGAPPPSGPPLPARASSAPAGASLPLSTIWETAP
jgi:serine/threonine protein kinase